MLIANKTDVRPDIPINGRQQKAVDYIRLHGNISNKMYQEINNVSKPTATRDLQKLVSLGIIAIKAGTSGKNILYTYSV